MSASPHFERAVELIAFVSRDLQRGRGTKKDERLQYLRYLNGALSALHSSVLLGERPVEHQYEVARERGKEVLPEEQ